MKVSAFRLLRQCPKEPLYLKLLETRGVLFKNNSLSELKKAICTVANMDEEEKCELIQKGYERMSMFSWENEAEKYYKIIEA